jgi:hypothetical protein
MVSLIHSRTSLKLVVPFDIAIERIARALIKQHHITQ